MGVSMKKMLVIIIAIIVVILIGLGVWFWNVTVEIGTADGTTNPPSDEISFPPVLQRTDAGGEIVPAATSATKVSPAPAQKTPAITSAASIIPQDARADITIAKFVFTPSPLTIRKGTTVVWTNKDDAMHTVSSDSGLFSSGSIIKGNSYSFTFEKTGTFPYTCGFHLGMQGVVEVIE